MHLAPLIRDLAVILITAGIITVVFRRIKQPVVLGYIAAGLILGPHTNMLVGIADPDTIEIWGEIGVIMLMFCHGLDFSLHKLSRVRKVALSGAFAEIFGMMVLAFAMCSVMGWGTVNVVFLGGMLAMSSTAIVFKEFHDLKLKDDYTGFASGILVIKDIAGVFLILIFSAFTPGEGFTGSSIGPRLWTVAAMLLLWLILGIYLIPTLFNRSINLMNDETLLIVSLAICFAMVMIADFLQIPTALGAYLAGALLAGTLHAERIERVVDPVRDLFGAAFFISVGMMLEPAVVVNYWLPIVIITVVTIIGKIFFSSGGVLLAGRSLKDSVQTACAIAQVGEFAFIIATAGVSSGALPEDVYSVIVVISVVTTVTTPYLIRHSDRVYDLFAAVLPDKTVEALDRETLLYVEGSHPKAVDVSWKGYLLRFIKRIVIYGLLMLSFTMLFYYAVYPLFSGLPVNPVFAKFASLLICYFVMAIFVRPMLDANNPMFYALWDAEKRSRIPLVLLNALRVIIMVSILFVPLPLIGGEDSYIAYPFVLLIVFALTRLKWFPSVYLRLETRFLANYNERGNVVFADAQRTREWLDEALDITDYVCGSAEDGRSLIELDWGRRYGVDVFQVDVNGTRFNMPNGTMRMQKGARLYLLGEPESIRSFRVAMGFSPRSGCFELRDFIAEQRPGEDALYCYLTKVDKDSMFFNKSIRGSGVRVKNDCMVIGLQRSGHPIAHPDPDLVVEKDDVLWLLGTAAVKERMGDLQEL